MHNVSNISGVDPFVFCFQPKRVSALNSWGWGDARHHVLLVFKGNLKSFLGDFSAWKVKLPLVERHGSDLVKSLDVSIQVCECFLLKSICFFFCWLNLLFQIVNFWDWNLASRAWDRPFCWVSPWSRKVESVDWFIVNLVLVKTSVSHFYSYFLLLPFAERSPYFLSDRAQELFLLNFGSLRRLNQLCAKGEKVVRIFDCLESLV